MRVPVVAVALCLAAALAAPQSLGDAARRQTHKRSTEAPATRVYTDADLSPKGDAPDGAPANLSAPRTPLAADLPVASAPVSTSEDAVRAQLDRETGERKQRERSWRQLAAVARAHLAAAQSEHDAVCGPNVLVLTGG